MQDVNAEALKSSVELHFTLFQKWLIWKDIYFVEDNEEIYIWLNQVEAII